MNLNQFDYLLAIYQHGSITKAAQELFVSVPSISTAIKNLEEELHCPLMMRHRYGVTFTEQGLEAIRILQEIENHLQQLRQLEHYHDTALAGAIHIGSSPHANHALSFPMLLEMEAIYPEVQISLIANDSQNILKMVAQGTLNLGVVLICDIDAPIFKREIHRNNLQYELILRDEMCFVVRKGHPAATNKTTTLSEILKYPYLTYNEALNEKTLALFQQYNPQQKIIQLDDRDILRRMLLQSEGCTLMPLSSENGTLLQFPDLEFLHLRDFSYLCEIGWLHDKTSCTRIEQIVINTLQKIATHL